MIIDGTTYHDKTPLRLGELLERARRGGWRLKLCYGYTEDHENGKAGQDWSERYGVTGYVGRSMGPEKVPLLLHNSLSVGGGAILDHYIVRVMFSNKRDGGDLYKHPKYHQLPNHVRTGE